MSALELRPAIESDSRLLFAWANDKLTRQMSFSSAEIPWTDHQRWFEEKLADATSEIYMAIDDTGESIGVVRFELAQAGAATISITVAPAHRGRGIGSQIIDLGCEQLLKGQRSSEVLAYIRPDNRGSLRIFERAGFSKGRDVSYAGQAALLLVRRL